MTAQRLAWLMGGCMLVTLAGCEVSIGKCDRDAGECFDWDDDEDASTDGGVDGEVEGDAATDGGDGDMDGGDTDGGDGDQDAGSDAGNVGEPLTIEEFCEAHYRRAIAWRDLFDTCFCPSDESAAWYGFLGQSLAYPSDSATVDCETKYDGLIDSGKVTFVSTKAGACADAFATQFEAPPANCPAAGFNLEELVSSIGHGTSVLAQLSACREAFVGEVAADGACNDSLECSGNLRCRPAPGGGNTCQAPVPEGGTCTSNGECADGHTCVGALNVGGGRVCRANDDLAINGGNCSFSRECIEGLLCDANKCVAPTQSNDENICQ